MRGGRWREKEGGEERWGEMEKAAKGGRGKRIEVTTKYVS